MLYSLRSEDHGEDDDQNSHRGEFGEGASLSSARVPTYAVGPSATTCLLAQVRALIAWRLRQRLAISRCDDEDLIRSEETVHGS